MGLEALATYVKKMGQYKIDDPMWVIGSIDAYGAIHARHARSGGNMMHGPAESKGKRWRWPFIHIWRSRTTCLCEIMAILDEINDPTDAVIAVALVEIAQETDMQAPRLPEPDAAPVRQRGHLSLRQVWEGAKRLLRPRPED